jgi:hypothetical protein
MSNVTFGSTSTTRSGQGYGLGSNQTGYTYGQGQYDRKTDYTSYPREHPRGQGQGWQVYGNTMYNKYKGQYGFGKKRRTRKNIKKSKRKISKKRHTKKSYKK